MQTIPLVRRLLDRLFPQPDPLVRAGILPGLYHFMRSVGGSYRRFHLRVDPDGNGLLLADATAAVRLHPSGVIIAKGLLEGQDEARVLQTLGRVFRGVTPAQMAADIAAVRDLIRRLESPGPGYPILNLADPSFLGPSNLPARPLSADVPLAPPDRLLPILGRLWDLGIPHVTILAGQGPPAVDLVRAVERAEDLGMISGVRGRASDLAQGTLLADLATAGIDHVNVLYLSSQAAVHDALVGAGDHEQARTVLAGTCQQEVCPVAEVALVEPTLATIEETLADLVSRGIASIGFYAIAAAGPASEGAISSAAVPQAAGVVEQSADRHGVRFLWYPPVEFDPAHALAEQVRGGPRCSGDTAVRVEPDGSVYPARGPRRPGGNLLREDWETILQHEVFRNYRRRLASDTHCATCPGLAICAANCPRDPAGWARSGSEE